jgi:hypothetical protein
MKRGLIIGVAVALLASAVAQAHPGYRWVCMLGDGFATTDGTYVTSGPWRVSMSYKTQRAIWAQRPTGEFGTPHGGNTVAQVACLMAQTVASDGLYAWDSIPKGNAVDLPNEPLVGENPGPFIGTFHCDGVTNGYTGNTYETCTHSAGKFGYISVKFTIEPNPNGS